VARDQLTIDNAFIGTESRAAGGGQIELRVGDLLFLTDAGEISSSVFGGTTTTAGDITIDPQFLILDGSQIIAQAAEGRGGNIRIVVDNLIQSPDSRIDASAGPAGINGTVVINTPDADVTGGLVALNAAVLDAAALLRERCAARRDVGASSFTGVGRGGLPASPDASQASVYRDPFDTTDGSARRDASQAVGGRRTPAIVLSCASSPGR
jgi:large exoprotein involved in heme utilization and adhesion